jgi:hypothetical protein
MNLFLLNFGMGWFIRVGICFVLFLGGEEDEDEHRTGRGRKSGEMGWA